MVVLMPVPALTFADASIQPRHWSAFWANLCRRAGGEACVTDWLIAQANARGFHGAFVTLVSPEDGSLALEDLLVGLLMPHAELDARVIKLVVRVLQSGRVDAHRLSFRARRERADLALSWVLGLLPESERNDATRSVEAVLRAPRAPTEVHFNYDVGRLIRRPASRDHLWRVKPS